MLGCYPTPVESVTLRDGLTLWVKRDDQTAKLYGGNKVRKLERILETARAQNKSKILTIGAVGSHHVLSTALFGRAAGFDVSAVLVPQLYTPHVEVTIRASLAAGLRPAPVGSYAAVPWEIFRRKDQNTFFITVGGSSIEGSRGYVDAATEFVEQVKRDEAPLPESVVVALGSGGTAAGLAVGFAHAGINVQVHAVTVSSPAWAVKWMLFHLVGKLCGKDRELARRARALVVVVNSQLGAGYGHPTPAAEAAFKLASSVGLELDLTYTAKAFAHASEIARATPRVLYWHTLSSVHPMAPADVDLPVEIQSLLLR